jgi:hypothetical protein
MRVQGSCGKLERMNQALACSRLTAVVLRSFVLLRLHFEIILSVWV